MTNLPEQVSQLHKEESSINSENCKFNELVLEAEHLGNEEHVAALHNHVSTLIDDSTKWASSLCPWCPHAIHDVEHAEPLDKSSSDVAVLAWKGILWPCISTLREDYIDREKDDWKLAN